MFTHRFRYLFALLLSVYTYLNTEFCQVYDYFNIRIEWYVAFGTILAITFLTLEGNRLIEPLLRKKIPPENYKTRFPVGFFLAGSVLSTLVALTVVLFVGMALHSFSLSENFTPIKLNLMYAWLVNLLFHLINTIIFYFKEYRSSRLEAEELKSAQALAELQLIKSQVNPHFLFNNLNVLSALVMQNHSEANRFIEEFSKVYRYILHNHENELVPLKTELHYINPYIFLLQKRFGDGLQVSIDIPEAYSDRLIIPAAIQMLIENAIKHNVVSRNRPLHISLHANGNNSIVITNNLQVKQSTEPSTGIGLRNIMKRYELVSDREVGIMKNESGFTVTLPLINPN
ncbi:MAG: histidine kinase [Ferruginibacter sp.]